MLSIALICLCANFMATADFYWESGKPKHSNSGIQFLIPLTNQENFAYFTSVNLGTPPQSFNLSIDTAGYRILVPDKDCESCTDFTNFFIPYDSDTYQGPFQTIRVNFSEDEYVIGNLSSETTSLGSETIAVAEAQSFLLIEEDNQVKFEKDGLFGLGFNLDDDTPTYIQTLAYQQVIKSPIFSLFLSNINRKNQPASTLIIGGTDDRFSEGSFTYLELADFRGYWEINITEISDPIRPMPIRGETAIIDSRAAMIWGPSAYIDQILYYFQEKFGCTGKYLLCKCDGEIDYPDITFTLEGNKYPVSYKSYFQFFSNQTCMLMIYSHNLTVWILGVPFLREYYSAYDMENLQIYLAPALKGDNESDSKKRLWVIIIVVIFALFSIAAVGLVSYCFYKKKRNPKKMLYKSIAMSCAMT
ncbi:CYM_5 [Blepharisma stoltei]|uniref:Peptidase A1 domain-containing protein n=1 Tax=Blepharisma stoltei TaxID=1481888 RepID=A0AAU9IY54_9CILI|nr:unnamed protein product [Blepharisma stoltei]